MSKSHELSQNFIQSRELADRMVRAANIGSGDLVVEPGAGRGIITEALRRTGAHVIAVEKDPQLVDGLKKRFERAPEVQIIYGDIMALSLPESEHYFVVGNPPFGISSMLIRKFVFSASRPSAIYLVLDKRMFGKLVGKRESTVMSVLVGSLYVVSKVFDIDPKSFSPRPQIGICYVRMKARNPDEIVSDWLAFSCFVVQGFTAWKPTIRDALGRVVPFRVLDSASASSGVHLDRSPSSLTTVEWISLFQAVTMITDIRRLRERLQVAAPTLKKLIAPNHSSRPRERVRGEMVARRKGQSSRRIESS